jgi:hypothetical protein
MKTLVLMWALMLSAGVAWAQDPNYNTEALKKAPRITQDAWQAMLGKTAATASDQTAKNNGELTSLGQSGVRVLKMSQSLELAKEETVVFEGYVSGQAAARCQFKLGPGKFEIKDGAIKRLP